MIFDKKKITDPGDFRPKEGLSHAVAARQEFRYLSLLFSFLFFEKNLNLFISASPGTSQQLHGPWLKSPMMPWIFGIHASCTNPVAHGRE
jgi:hypothetical protein